MDEFSNNLAPDEQTALIEDKTIPTQSNVTGSSWYVSVFLVVNAALGAGLLNFPAAYSQSGGLVVAISIQALLMVFVLASLIILIYCAEIKQSASYQDVVFSWCGKKMQMVAAFAVVLYAFGTCITFFIIIGDQWDKLLASFESNYCVHWYFSRTFTMVATSVIFVLPMCYPKRIDFLKYASMIGVLAIVYCVILVSVKYYVSQEINTGHIKTRPDHWSDVFVVVPVICFGYQCHLSVVPIYSCMKKRTVLEFTKTLLVALAISIFAYTGTASFGYLTFGDTVNEDVLLSYKPITTDVRIAVALIAIKMYTTVPILTFVGRVGVESLWVFCRRISPEDVQQCEQIRRCVIVTIWFATSLFLAVVLPNIGVVISLLGGLAAIFAFVFPGLCLLQVILTGHINKTDSIYKYYTLLVLSSIFIVFGMFVFGLVTTQALMQDFSSHSHTQHLNQTCP